jgi:hypothetical protein
LTFGSRRLLTSIAVLLAAGAAGCGGGEDDNKKFVSETNKICTDAQKDIEAAGSDTDKIISVGDKLIDDLKAVDPPEDKKSDYEAWVKTQEDYFDELKDAIESRDAQKLQSLDDNAGDEQARDLGLDRCTG